MVGKNKRILLKLSGEILKSKTDIFDPTLLNTLVSQLMNLLKEEVEIGIVVGGGNIFRGGRDSFASHIDRTIADDIGMLATGLNALALKAYFQKHDLPTAVYGAFEIQGKISQFSLEAVLKDLTQKRIVIFCGGTGLPFFSTDSAAAVRAAEIKADILLKATNVDGVYEKDPKKYANAKRFDRLTFAETLSLHIKVMDTMAFAFCMETNTPIFVFNFSEKDSLLHAVRGTGHGTLISD